MSPWFAVIAASLAVFSWKLFGYLLPRRLLESDFLNKLAGYLTISLMAGLVGVQTFVSSAGKDAGQQVVLDERVPALLVAMLLLKLKAPFIVIVIVAAAVAASLRLIF